jgi:hypothetical protein
MRIHLPTDCALLFAIPLTKEEFFEDSRSSSNKQYARLFRMRLAGLSDEDVWARYKTAVVQPAVSVQSFIQTRGVFTAGRATAEVWHTTLRHRPVVSLVAHWHGAGFTVDMLERVPELIQEIKAAKGPAGRAMARALIAAAPSHLGSLDTLTRVLNAALRATAVIPEELQAGDVWVENDPDQILDRNFEVLRTEFPHWELQPAGMELADGIYPVTEMVSTFSHCYEGTLDLRMCHSIILGEAIKRAAPQARLVMNRRPVTPSVQLPLYQEVVQMLETKRYDFAGAVTSLQNALMERLI